ncbi:MAG: hypothetical protein K2X32_04695 [Phycisphaerales bacterium]|nr:hypothetical protein [Phycisphaerales bacterium]
MSSIANVSRAAGSAADTLSASDALVRSLSALVGFDGFVDHIIDVVDTRSSMRRDDYRAIRTMGEYSARVAAFAGKSMNLEMVVKESRFGGNGPLMAGGLAMLGVPTTYVGCVGQGGGGGGGMALHPLYEELERRCVGVGGRVIPVAPPAVTHALEFDDGKVMQGDPQNLYSVTWETVKRAMSGSGDGDYAADLGAMVRQVEAASLIGIVNWVMMPSVGGAGGIWDGLIREVLPRLGSGVVAGTGGGGAGGARRVFIDLCDPAKRTDADVAEALRQISAMASARALDGTPSVRITLGLNLSEAERIDQVCGAGGFAGDRYTPGDERSKLVIARASAAIRARLGLDCVVIHPREGAAASVQGNPESERGVWLDGPLTEHPKLSTGAGDHFNSGFALAQLLNMDAPQCLAVATGVSGVYVRDAMSPTRQRLTEFLRSRV